MGIFREGRRGAWMWTIAVPLCIAGLLLLTGCLAGDEPPAFVENRLGTVTASTVASAAANPGQRLFEYGVIYSTVETDVVNVSGVATTGTVTVGSITLRPGVKKVSIPCTARSVAPTETGTLSANIPNLRPNTRYYLRFYTIGSGMDPGGFPASGVDIWLLKVGSYRTMSRDATQKSLKPSTGALSPSFSRWRYSYRNVIASNKAGSTLTALPNVSGSKVRMRIGGGSWKTTTAMKVNLA